MTESIGRDRFDDLLTTWKRLEDGIGELKDQQGDVVSDISQLFGDIITIEQLLADLPWEVYTYPSGTEISCSVKDGKGAEFLEKMVWRDFKYHFSGRIEVGGNQVSINNDGLMTIYFGNGQRRQNGGFDDSNGVEGCIKFCQEQGITPEVTAINDQRQLAQDKADRLTQIIESLT